MDFLTIGAIAGGLLLANSKKKEKDNPDSRSVSSEDDKEAVVQPASFQSSSSNTKVISVNSEPGQYVYAGLEPARLYKQVTHNTGKGDIAVIRPKTYLGILTEISYHDWVKVRTNIEFNGSGRDYFFWVNKRNIRVFDSLEDGAKYGRNKLVKEIKRIING